MEPKVNYIISNYLGERRYSPRLNSDPLYYLKKQCDYFKNNHIPNLTSITFVLNRSNDSSRDEKFIEFVNNINLGIKTNLLIRENKGFSYGAWQEAVIENIDYDYSFLVEDDYIPNDVNFLNYFLHEINDKTVYLCPLYTDHCAISIGLLNHKIVKEILKTNKNSPLNVIDCDDNYVGGCENQRIFLSNFKEAGYSIRDIKDNYQILFSNHNGTLQTYGNWEGPLIFRPIS